MVGLLLTMQTDPQEFIKDIVAQTSGFMPRDLQALLADAGANLLQKRNEKVGKAELKDSDGSLEVKPQEDSNSPDAPSPVMGKEDLSKAMERSKKRSASALGAPKVIGEMD